MTGKDAVDVRQENQRVGFHHLCDEAGEFIVIGEHQLSDTHSVVLIDDRQYVVLQHHRHTGLLIPVLLTWSEVLLHRQNLTYMDAELTEQVVVEAHEFHLSDSGEQLALFHGVERVVNGQFASSTGHGS